MRTIRYLMLVLWGGVAVTACSEQNDPVSAGRTDAVTQALGKATTQTFDPCTLPIFVAEGDFINQTCTLDDTWPTSAVIGQHEKGIHWGANNRILAVVGSPVDDNIVEGIRDINLTLPTDGTIAEKTAPMVRVGEDDSTTVFVEYHKQVITQARPATITWDVDVYYLGDPMTWPVGDGFRNENDAGVIKLGSQQVELAVEAEDGVTSIIVEKITAHTDVFRIVQPPATIFNFGVRNHNASTTSRDDWVDRSGNQKTGWSIDAFELAEIFNREAQADGWNARMTAIGTDYRDMQRGLLYFKHHFSTEILPEPVAYSVKPGRLVIKGGRTVVGGLQFQAFLHKNGQFVQGEPQFPNGDLVASVFLPRLSTDARARKVYNLTTYGEVVEIPVMGTLTGSNNNLSVVENEPYTCNDGSPITIQVSISKGRNSRVFNNILIYPNSVPGAFTARLAYLPLCP